MTIGNDVADYMEIESTDEVQKLYFGTIYCKNGFIAHNAFVCYDGKKKNIKKGYLDNQPEIITEPKKTFWDKFKNLFIKKEV